MTLREESGNAPPTGSETGGQPQELPAQPQELPGQPQEPPGQPQEPRGPRHRKQSRRCPRRGNRPPRWRYPHRGKRPPRRKVPAPREAPPQLEVPAPREAPPPLAAVAPPQEPAAVPGTPGGHAAPAEPGPGTGPASPGGGPPRRRRSLAAILVGGFAAVCLIGLGAFATVLLLHGRHHAPPPALPSVFRLRVGKCVNSGPRRNLLAHRRALRPAPRRRGLRQVRAGRAQLAGERGHRRPGPPGLHGQARRLSQPAVGHHCPSGIVRFSRPGCVERRRAGGYLRNP